MTEDDAKTKWCPFARVVEHSSAGVTAPRNRVATLLEALESGDVLSADLFGAECIGSACMAWRRGESVWRQSPSGRGGEYEPTGYCGLAGTPS